MVRDLLRSSFPPQKYKISSWRDKEGALLAAVQVETAVLNVLLFMIIAVAGFGILAIFFMIVFEKTRDIGILKSLGASTTFIISSIEGEALFVGIMGVCVGLLAAYGASVFIGRQFNLAFEFSTNWVLTAIAIAIGGSLFGALYR